jgi:hypothetical protein
MYRINFYPEYTEKRQRAKRRALRMATLTAVLGIEGLCVICLFLSGLLVRERVRSVKAEIGGLTVQLQEKNRPNPQLDTAMEMVNLRATRINWSPMLNVLARRIDPGLRLDECTGRSGAKKALIVSGVVRSGGGDLQPVTRLLKALQEDPAVAADFPEVQLGNLGGSDAGRFLITCQSSGKAP